MKETPSLGYARVTDPEAEARLQREEIGRAGSDDPERDTNLRPLREAKINEVILTRRFEYISVR